MTLSDLAKFLAENHLLLHVIRLKPAKVFTAVLEPTSTLEPWTPTQQDRFEASDRDSGKAVEKVMAKFELAKVETWLQGKPRT